MKKRNKALKPGFGITELRFCEECGDVLSDDEHGLCKRCKFERRLKHRRRRRVIALTCVAVGVGAACYVSYKYRRELLEKTEKARDMVTETVKKIPVDRGVTVVKRAGGAAGEKIKEVRILIDDKLSEFKK